MPTLRLLKMRGTTPAPYHIEIDDNHLILREGYVDVPSAKVTLPPNASELLRERCAQMDKRGISYVVEKGVIKITAIPPKEQKILSFFSPTSPCPFVGCEELRAKFNEEKKALGSDCSDCDEGQLIAKYRKIIEEKIL